MKLVLIPGLDGTGDLFAPFLETLGETPSQVIAYPPDREMDYAEHEAHVRARLPADEEFVLLAESFSGPVGISIAASPPKNLKALILCVSFASNPLPVFGPLRRLLRAAPAVKIPPVLFAPFLYGGHASAELRRSHASAMSKVTAATLRARVAAILGVDHSALLRNIAIPMQYLQATDDRLVPGSAFKKIQRVRPDIAVVAIQGPHFLLQVQPRKCAHAVMDFVEYGMFGKDSPQEPPDEQLSSAQSERTSRLTSEELSAIDQALLDHSCTRWRKVARVVGTAIGELQARIPDVPDVFYAQRVRLLVQEGKLQSQGNLGFMRYSEIRLPAED